MADATLFSLPFLLVGVFWFIGLLGTWRGAVASLALSYAALIVACQHNSFVAGTELVSALSSGAGPVQRSALAFALSLCAAYLGLQVLFAVAWGPAKRASARGCMQRLAQSMLTSVAGWVLGVMLAASIVMSQTGDTWLPDAGAEVVLYREAVMKTTRATVGLVLPWLSDAPPLFLYPWESALP
ncbi:MAG: hypothetical protein GXY76_22775 [Chloroflexi bacterium]|nr:hypothetical protein [Chloroflexota bacterium]